jgi:hypothetical protein
MVAWYDNRYQIDIEGETEWDWLMRTMNDACTAFTALGTNLTYFSWGSDHVPFQNEGFPAFLAIESDYFAYPCYHQTCDVTANNNADFGADVTRASLATVAHLAEPVGTTSIAELEAITPATIRLLGSAPNPFNPLTTIRFDISRAGGVELTIHHVSGRLVRVLVSDRLDAGVHAFVWDGTTASGGASPSGVYFYTLAAGDASETGRLVLAR